MRLPAMCLGLLALGTLAKAADNERFVHAGPSQAVKILGSEDLRSGFTVGVQWSQDDKRLSRGGLKIQSLWEAYILSSRGGGVDNYPKTTTFSLGGLYGARWQTPVSRDLKGFFDLGIGIQASDKVTADLDLHFNSTPFAAVGFKSKDWQVMFRWLHISNGGVHMPNRGQNHFQLLFGYSF